MVKNGDGCVMPSECPTVTTTTEEEMSRPTRKPKPDSNSTEEDKSRPTRKPTPDPASCSASGKVYMECGTACPRICDTPSPLFCTEQCVVGR